MADEESTPSPSRGGAASETSGAAPDPSPHQTSSIDPISYICPHCAEAISIEPTPSSPFVTCPNCNGEFAIASHSDDDPDTREREEAIESRDGELDGTRIRQLSIGRRAAICAQGYLMAGMCASGFGVIAAAIDIVKQLNQRISFSIYILARIALIAVLSYLTIFFFHRWREAGKELKKSRLVEPTTPPDFSELSDGSRQIDHLENLK